MENTIKEKLTSLMMYLKEGHDMYLKQIEDCEAKCKQKYDTYYFLAKTHIASANILMDAMNTLAEVINDID